MSTSVSDLDDFCRQEHPRLSGSLTLYTGDPDLAAELAQEALARACRDWSRVRVMAAPGAWVHRVGINLANSTFARRAAERRARARHDARPREVAPDSAAALAVRAAVAALPRRQRTAVILRYFVDMSVADAADAMQCAPGTVKALTSQAIDRLRTVGLVDVEDDDEEDLDVAT